MIHLTRKQSDDSPINYVGAIAEAFAHLARAVFRVYVERGRQDRFFLFLDRKGDVKGLIGQLL